MCVCVCVCVCVCMCVSVCVGAARAGGCVRGGVRLVCQLRDSAVLVGLLGLWPRPHRYPETSGMPRPSKLRVVRLRSLEWPALNVHRLAKREC